MASIVKKLLIANRGEIALRVVRTAKEMGISTVAVYSEQDRNSRYVDMADEAYLLSGDTYKDTYLNEDLLIDILHKTGADAVHPGYGFLSEVPSFAQKVEDAGAIWVGPHHTALVDLGDKITARRVALRAKVPPVPGLSEPVTDVRTLLDFAHTHGYPIMMKRTDGGGGHGRAQWERAFDRQVGDVENSEGQEDAERENGPLKSLADGRENEIKHEISFSRYARRFGLPIVF